MADFETDNYLIKHMHLTGERLIVVFVSAGGVGPGGRLEEFGQSLSRCGVSVIFVKDKHAWWYNHSDTREVLARIAGDAAIYPNVASLGESMGGCGAIAFGGLNKEIVSRVLAFSPQFSIAQPFIAFDQRYSWIGAQIGAHVFTDFARPDIASKVQILFGDADQLDLRHASEFIAAGHTVSFVEGAGHEVASYLKHTASNRLNRLLEAFTDFDHDFEKDRVYRILNAN